MFWGHPACLYVQRMIHSMNPLLAFD
jgi:hypothetical protein